MLIAIMGDTFNKNNQVEKQLRCKDHLSFVLDNWYLNKLSFLRWKQKPINYIMTAFQVHDKNDEIESIKRIYEKIEEVDEDLRKENDRIFKKQKDQDVMINKILKALEQDKYEVTGLKEDMNEMKGQMNEMLSILKNNR